MKWLYSLFFIVFPLLTQAQQATVFYNQKIVMGRNVMIGQDKSGTLSVNDVIRQLEFKPSNQDIINLGVSSSIYWFQFSILNKSKNSHLLLDISRPDVNLLTLYSSGPDNKPIAQQLGNIFTFSKRIYNNQDFIFDINIPSGEQRIFFLRVKSSTQMLLPLQLGSEKDILEYLSIKDLIFGLFFGLVCAMFFYNLFIYFTVRDPIYLYYVGYILVTTVSQCTLQGYSFKYFWPSSTWLAQNGIFLFTNLGGISAVIFTKKFLQTKYYAPKLNVVFSIVAWVFVLSIVLMLFNKRKLSFVIMQNTTLMGSLLTITMGVTTFKRGYEPAKFFLFAWFSLCIGATIFVLKDYGILPVNTFTSNTIEFGFALEGILLSFALADKINTYKKEKDISQAQALRVSQENEQLIQEQNTMLEKQVAERTHDLEKTLRELKDAQIQLVEAEKMASLGQLTAGIAHEINNPINFVKSNVSPLQMDVQDLFELITEYQKLHDVSADTQPDALKKIRLLENKLDPDFLREEIESLIGGIEEGAERTAEIVRGLRSFSRLDESESKEVNVYENINSTLVLLRNNVPHYVKVRKQFEARAEIECFPGKLNQVFMNILTNSIHAIKAKPVKNEEEFIDISTAEVDGYMQIRIADTGTGMSEDVKRKIFEPFFTTKDVGEGTGLGMAIVFKIIEKHNGKISVQSSPGEGSAFIIEIPYLLVPELAMAENIGTENNQTDL